MKKRILCLALACAALLALALPAAAAPAIPTQAAGKSESVSIPVYLTVVHTTKNINVTLPASLPVGVVDGRVLTADNLRITNNSTTQGVRVTSITVSGSGTYAVGDYAGFDSAPDNVIALQINGCGTDEAGGALELGDAFPEIAAGAYIPVRYDAKVSDNISRGDLEAVNAAQVIFTLASIG